MTFNAAGLREEEVADHGYVVRHFGVHGPGESREKSYMSEQRNI